MKFTDVFVHRPVLASVVSLLILVLGLRAVLALEIREYPKTLDTVVTVTTLYPGANSQLVQGFITIPLQQAIAEADGIDYLTASSTQGQSIIEAHMELNYDPNAAVSEIQAKVASQRDVLPEETEDPTIDYSTGDQTALMYLAFYSDVMTPPEITDYLLRVVRPKLQAVPGVAQARLIGNRSFAMRIWLDPNRMASFDVTPNDVRRALARNNFLAGVGQAKGQYVAVDLDATTDVGTEEDFRNLVVRRTDNTLIRIKDLATAELGAETYESDSWYKNQTAIYIGVEQAPGANPLAVAQRVHDVMPEIRSQLPEGLSAQIPYDASVFIEDSIQEVFRTLAEAVLIVLFVIFLSLGSARAALVPAVTVPLSLIGGAFLMLLMGFSINLLTLLALVLAIGLVVDDAIVVVENVHRHLLQGEDRLQAALQGIRELGLPIIAMTTTLAAVYAPIGFMTGLVGTLFTEFAFALAGAVIVSGIVALTLAPMMSGKVLKVEREPGPFERGVESFFTSLAGRYQRLLHHSLDYRPVTMTFAAIVLASLYPMFVTSQNELAPTEDQSILFFQATAPQTATVDYNLVYTKEMHQIFETIPEYHESFFLIGRGGNVSGVFGGFKMQPPSVRQDAGQRSQMEIQPELQKKLAGVAGFQIAVFPRPSLPGAGRGLPVQFVLNGEADYRELDRQADLLIKRGTESGTFTFLQKSVRYTRPKTIVKIDRNRAGVLGIDMQDAGEALATMLGTNEVNRFSLEGRSYEVIPQVERRFRLDPQMLDQYYVRTASAEQVPLSTIVSFQRTVEPSERTQFQQLNSLILQGVPAPGVSLGEALTYLRTQAAALPREIGYDYAGESRQFTQQGAALVITFFMAILVIYLVLAAQFESWRDPLIILVSVPMSIAGALAFITLGFATINIYTQVGLITLIGLIAKNGILIVEFANQIQRREGLDKRQAVENAASIRLRPILMTTISMLVAMIPLLMASGPGAVSRVHIGLVIFAGLGIGTLFTLFVVPAVYVQLAARHYGEGTPSPEEGAS